MLETPGSEHRQHPVAPSDCTPDHLPIVGSAWEDGDAALESGELAHALGSADADDLVAAGERVLRHVLPELSGDSDDADAVDG